MGTELPEASGTHSILGTNHYDGVFEALTSARRRAALAHLREEDCQVSLETLTTEIARSEQEADGPTLRRETWNDVAAALAHAHLPKLADEGLVEYDEEAETIALGERAELALAQLDAMRSEE